MAQGLRIIALTAAGADLAQRIKAYWPDAQFSYKPKPFIESVQGYFKAGEALVFICATGIVVRALAPVLAGKLQDPPVLVLDEAGNFVLPLLSGHEGGANDLAARLALRLNAQCVITTAKGYLAPRYTVGMGCERHCPEQVLEQLLMQCLAQAGLSLDQVSAIASIDVKADEQGLISLAQRLAKPYLCYSAEQLSAQTHLLSVKSDYVFNTVGVYGVAESAALESAQALAVEAYIAETNSGPTLLKPESVKAMHRPELVLNKQKNPQATCAIARCYIDKTST